MRNFNVKLNKDVYPAIRPKEKKNNQKDAHALLDKWIYKHPY